MESNSYLTLIDTLCDEYERQLKSGMSPDLTGFVGGVPAEAQSALLRELNDLREEYEGKVLPRSASAENESALPGDITKASDSATPVSASADDADPQAVPPLMGTPEAAPSEPLRAAGPRPRLPAMRSDEAMALAARFTIHHELGFGRFGRVFLATDNELGRQVAVKIARSEVLRSDELRTRFLREARAIARLEHPGIVRVYECGEISTVLYIAMKLCGGESMASWLTKHPSGVAPQVAASLMLQIAEAVHHAHACGVVHRDLKPANVIVSAPRRPDQSDGWQTHVVDFGLARFVEPGLPDTRSSLIMGTPLYMSPEQAGGRLGTVGVASDVYSLGVMFVELLTGSLPFADGALSRIMAHVSEPDPFVFGRHLEGVDVRLRSICLACLRPLPQDRYATADDLARDIRSYLDGAELQARPLTILDRIQYWMLQRRRVDEATMVIISLNAALAGFCAIGVAGILLSSEVEILPDEQMSTVGSLLFVALPVHVVLAWVGWLRSRMRFSRLLQRSIVLFCSVMTGINLAIACGSLNAVSWYARNPGARILVFALSTLLWFIQSVAWLLIDRHSVVESPPDEPAAELATT